MRIPGGGVFFLPQGIISPNLLFCPRISDKMPLHFNFRPNASTFQFQTKRPPSATFGSPVRARYTFGLSLRYVTFHLLWDLELFENFGRPRPPTSSTRVLTPTSSRLPSGKNWLCMGLKSTAFKKSGCSLDFQRKIWIIFERPAWSTKSLTNLSSLIVV